MQVNRLSDFYVHFAISSNLKYPVRIAAQEDHVLVNMDGYRKNIMFIMFSEPHRVG